MSWHENCQIEGDLQDFDYTAYYAGKETDVLKAAGFQKSPAKMIAIREALRVNVPIAVNRQIPDGEAQLLDHSLLSAQIREWNKSGCYKMAIFEKRFDPIYKLILWKDHRMRAGDSFYNSWKHGNLTAKELLRQEEEELQRKLQSGLPGMTPRRQEA
jgi:hypothetical protein